MSEAESSSSASTLLSSSILTFCFPEDSGLTALLLAGAGFADSTFCSTFPEQSK
jgi:hypothetical protein